MIILCLVKVSYALGGGGICPPASPWIKPCYLMKIAIESPDQLKDTDLRTEKNMFRIL